MGFYDERERQDPYHFAKLRSVLEFLAGTKQILELGCGHGDFLHLCKLAGLKAEGVDLWKERILGCQRRGLKATQMDALKAVKRIKPGSVDAIYSSNVVEHLQPNELLAWLDAIAAKLKPGAKLAIHTTNGKSIGIIADVFWTDLTHVRVYPPELLRPLLEERGFEVLEAGGDERTRIDGPMRRAVRMIRTALVGRYFGPPEIRVLAIKRP